MKVKSVSGTCTRHHKAYRMLADWTLLLHHSATAGRMWWCGGDMPAPTRTPHVWDGVRWWRTRQLFDIYVTTSTASSAQHHLDTFFRVAVMTTCCCSGENIWLLPFVRVRTLFCPVHCYRADGAYRNAAIRRRWVKPWVFSFCIAAYSGTHFPWTGSPVYTSKQNVTSYFDEVKTIVSISKKVRFFGKLFLQSVAHIFKC